MATIILSAAGNALGGPVGGAIGAVIGQFIDQKLFAPKGRQGPRLGDLSVQTSTYGSPIPRLFGTMRVAGTVIWSTDLIERRSRSRAGKNGPKITTYNYSVSFAVALSARNIRSVRRIWADGKLLRGAGGDWKSAIGTFRLHPGDEGQPVDPRIAAEEGAAGTPAYRGMAIAVFEDLQLADFGNRIPSLTFEVEADAGPVPVARIIGDLVPGIACDCVETINGFAATGDSRRAAIADLATAFALRPSQDAAGMTLTSRDGALVVVREDMAGAHAPQDDRRPRMARRQLGADLLPDGATVSFYDIDRDYQAGVQQARLSGPPSRPERIGLAMAMTSGQARLLAERVLQRRWDQQTSAELHLPWRLLDLSVGDVLQMPDGARWQAHGIRIERGVTIVQVRRVGDPAMTAVLATDPGRATKEPDRAHGPTVLALVDAPLYNESIDGQPRIWLAAAGTLVGWRQAQLGLSLDDGASWPDAGKTIAPAIIGKVAATSTIAAAAERVDRTGSFTVTLLHDGMVLHHADADALASGANAALLGSEILQFGRADPLGNRQWKLSELWRGRMGTEAAMALHAVGEDFVLLDRDSLTPIDVPVSARGSLVRVQALGVGDVTGPVTATITAGLPALVPPSPAHLRLLRSATGDPVLHWVRRSRAGFAWIDGVDSPLAEASENYGVELFLSAGPPIRSATVDSPVWTYGAAMRAADGVAPGTPVTASVRQIGTWGTSGPAVLTFVI